MVVESHTSRFASPTLKSPVVSFKPFGERGAVVSGPNAGGKPSETHIIWSRETRDGVTRKRFDSDQFEEWADQYGVAFEREERVDHERAMDERTQYRCVFARTTEGEEGPLDRGAWQPGDGQTPRTFIEIDSEGVARIQGWEKQTIVDITALLQQGSRLLVRTADDETMPIDARALAEPPEE
jgi:hypothetical protein